MQAIKYIATANSLNRLIQCLWTHYKRFRSNEWCSKLARMACETEWLGIKTVYLLYYAAFKSD